MWFGLLASAAAAPSNPPPGSLPVIIADFNNDGIPDVLIPSATSPTATIAFGSVPYGTFNNSTRAVTFPAACTSLTPGSVLVGDINGDGLPDIVFFCGDAGGTAGVMLGNGDGTFGAAKLTTGVFATGGVLGDFNKDGKLDLVAIGPTGSSIGTQGMQFFAGNGDGTFAAVVTTTFANGAFYTSPVAADVNGDGYPDLVLGNFHSDTAPTVDVYGNNKNGTFGVTSSGGSSPGVSATVGAAGTLTNSVILTGSFFGSGTTDLAVTDTGSNPGFFLIKNTSTATTFSLAAAVKTTVTGLVAGRAGNVTGSGFTDLVAANGTNVTVLVNDGAGNFTPSYTTLQFASTATDFSVGDANGDGYADIYTAALVSTNLQLAVNLVSGSATATSQPFSLGIGTKAVTATWPGDIDFTGSTAKGTQTVNGVATMATVTSTKNPSLVGDTITLTASITSTTETSRIPSGMVVLKDGSATLASGSLDATGNFSYTTSALTQATHSIQAVYAGDTYFAGSTSAIFSQVVNHAAPVAPTLSWASPAPIAFGTPLSATQLNASATDANGTPVPGTYAYVPAAGAILDAGTQTLSVTFTPTDTQSFTTASKSVSLTVLQATPATTLALTSGGTAASTVSAGSVVTLTAAVGSGTGKVVHGQVTFCDATAAHCTDVHLLGAAQLTAAGTAKISFVPGIGSHSYKAIFSGTKNNATSTSTNVSLSVTGKYATSTTIAQSGVTGNYTLTATTVGVGSLTAAPTGTVSFLDTSNNKASLGSGPLGAPTPGIGLLSASSSPTGREPEFVAVGDFNGDGKQDLAIANYGTLDSPSTGRTLTILLGNGDGTFSAAASPSTGNGPYSIAVGDFNEDGIVDLAVTNSLDNTVTVLLGNGDGTFTPAPGLPTGSTPFGIVAGDFNGDGHADLAVANSGDGTVTILLGNGDGTFTPTAPFAVATGPAALAVADFNSDGNPDLAIANLGTSGLTVLLGNGDGTFTSSSNAQSAGVVGGQFATVAVGDFNNDGNADIVVASQTGQNALAGAVLLGKGDGTFSSATGLGSDPTYSFSLGVRDFNGDGKPDIVIADNNRTTILLSNGDGTFTPAASVPAVSSTTPDFLAVAVGDFNGDGVPDTAVANSTADSVNVLLTQLTQTATATATAVNPTGAGTHQVIASYPGDTSYSSSVSAPTTLNGSQILPTLTWTPAVSTIVYGTPLGPQQLNAVATDLTGAPIPGTFTYLPAAGTLLNAGTQKLTVSFKPSSTHYLPVSGSTTIAVTKATPTLTWAPPASIAYGIPLSATQLNATVTGIAGQLPGVFTYNPAAGTVLNPGVQTLTVNFVPTDALDYISVSGSVQLTVTGLTLTSFTPNTATLGDGNKTITLTGSGFVANSVVLVNGSAIATRLVNPTTLTAVLPASDFAAVGTLQIAVKDPSLPLITAALPLTVTAPTPVVTLTGPSTTPPGSQPSLTFTVKNPYPAPLTVVLTLGFAPSVAPAVDDPAIQFASGGRTLTFVVPANSTVVPTIQLQAGTVAGTITVPLTLTSGGANVTPTTLQPVVIVIPTAIPTVSTATLTRNVAQLSVTVHGFSNTREITQANFHFVGINGVTIDTPDITAPVGTLFATWYASTQSTQYGSTFTYTQVFNVSDNANNIGSVQVTLTNAVGKSAAGTAQ